MEQYIIETMRPEWITYLDWWLWIVTCIVFVVIFATFGKEAWDSFKF